MHIHKLDLLRLVPVSSLVFSIAMPSLCHYYAITMPSLWPLLCHRYGHSYAITMPYGYLFIFVSFIAMTVHHVKELWSH